AELEAVAHHEAVHRHEDDVAVELAKNVIRASARGDALHLEGVQVLGGLGGDEDLLRLDLLRLEQSLDDGLGHAASADEAKARARDVGHGGATAGLAATRFGLRSRGRRTAL